MHAITGTVAARRSRSSTRAVDTTIVRSWHERAFDEANDLPPRIFSRRAFEELGPYQLLTFIQATTCSGIAITRTMAYRCVAASPEGLVQLVAASYLRHGYRFYVTGRIKPSKAPREVDEKLIAKYGIDISQRERPQRKEQGLANMQYVRYESWFILLATEGHHPFKQNEKRQIRDCRRVPIRFEGYSISQRRCGITPKGGGDPKWRSCVRIDKPTYRQLKAFFLDRATHRSVDNLRADFARIPYARYAPIRRQLLTILRAVNKAREPMGYDPVPHSALMLRRTPIRVYEDEAPEKLAA